MNRFKTIRAAALAIGVSWAALGSWTPAAVADQVIPDNLIVQQSLCVGFDCVSGEAFNFSTIRLKENNTRLDFHDTSVGSFAARDWRIEANSNLSGGANYLAIKDMGDAANGAEGGTAILTATAGAPANSIFIGSTGRVGFRTATPVLDMHANTSNTPGLRLEQNGSGGFSPQTWDVAGNEANFFVRDVTNGSLLSFRIRPGAPTSSLDIAADGDVGMGTASPADALHVRRASGPVAIRLDSGSQPNAIRLNFNTTLNEFRITYEGSGINQFRLTSAGNLIIPGTITTSGTCSGGCDRVFSPDYDLPTIDEHADLMFEKGYLPGVGPTVEGQPMNLTHKVEGMLNELEKAHIYIAELEAARSKLAERIEALERDR